MEQNEKRYRADRDALLRSVMGLESGLLDLSQANGEGVLGMDKNKKRKRGEEPETVETPIVQSDEHLGEYFWPIHADPRRITVYTSHRV